MSPKKKKKKKIISLCYTPKGLGSIWLDGWKSGRIENCGMMKKWENRKYFIFSHFCLVGSGKVEG